MTIVDEPAPIPGTPERVFTTRELTRLLRLSPKRASQLRRLGLLGPDEARYGFRDLVGARVATALLEAGAGVREVRQALEGARRLLPGTGSPLSELRLSVRGRRVVAAHGDVRFDPRTGQALLDLDLDDLEREARESLTRGLVRPMLPRAASADSWFERASRWDGDPERWTEAVDAYARVIAIDSGYAAAWNNLGLLQHRMGHYGRAGECYRAALAADDLCVQAAFNLGSLHEDLGEMTTAVSWYRRALELDPGYADAHFNLAGALGRMGSGAAALHWRRYLELDPASPWADIARSHLAEAGGDTEDLE
ncbi:MAG TPA: tetratricopeptide repeat protein [Candidatus Binatia bacterium]|nr:tetratricopeptide repeat protein [Candidatus Binatia bacterium]